MVEKCVFVVDGHCFKATLAEMHEADARRHPSTAHEHVASWLGTARDRVDEYVQDKGRNPILRTAARGVAVNLGLISAVADTGLSIVSDTVPSVHAMVTGKVSLRDMAAGMGEQLVVTAESIPNTYKEVFTGDHPAEAAHAGYSNLFKSYLIVDGGAMAFKGGMTVARAGLAPIRTVAEGAADAVANNMGSGGMGMVLAEGAVRADGGVAAGTVAAAGGWPSGFGVLAAMSGKGDGEGTGAVDEAAVAAPPKSLRVATQAEFDAELAKLDKKIADARRITHDSSVAIYDSPGIYYLPYSEVSIPHADRLLPRAMNARSQFIRANYDFVSAAAPESSIAAHLAAHLDTAPDLGPKIRFGEGAVFKTPEDLIRFTEEHLRIGFEGGAKPGDIISASIGDQPVMLRYLEAGTKVDGVAVGPTSVADLTIIEMEAKIPLGDGTIKAGDGSGLTVRRLSGGLEDEVMVANGPAVPTHKLYIIGGRYRDVGAEGGQYGLYTIYPGPFAPPVSDAAYWSSRAFVTGDTSFVVDAAVGKTYLIEGSNFHRMVEAGKIALPEGVTIRSRGGGI